MSLGHLHMGHMDAREKDTGHLNVGHIDTQTIKVFLFIAVMSRMLQINSI